MKMNYNKTVIISILITLSIALAGVFSVTLFFEERTTVVKGIQLVLAIFVMTTLYTPIKFKLLKLFKIKEGEEE